MGDVELGKPLDASSRLLPVEDHGAGGYLHDARQRAARLVGITVPHQMSQAISVEGGMAERDLVLQLRSQRACQRLLDMTHTHGDVKPIQNVSPATYGRAHGGHFEMTGLKAWDGTDGNSVEGNDQRPYPPLKRADDFARSDC